MYVVACGTRIWSKTAKVLFTASYRRDCKDFSEVPRPSSILTIVDARPAPSPVADLSRTPAEKVNRPPEEVLGGEEKRPPDGVEKRPSPADDVEKRPPDAGGEEKMLPADAAEEKMLPADAAATAAASGLAFASGWAGLLLLEALRSNTFEFISFAWLKDSLKASAISALLNFRA